MGVLKQAERLATLVAECRVRVVLAESCTAGLASAVLARIPGISDWHCGSAVTYREATKQSWLGVSAQDLEEYTAVSEPVARQMALGVLERTLEADYSASVTGHLGPNAPEGYDGVIYVAVAQRHAGRVSVRQVTRFQLQQVTRRKRQKEAAAFLLRQLSSQIKSA